MSLINQRYISCFKKNLLLDVVAVVADDDDFFWFFLYLNLNILFLSFDSSIVQRHIKHRNGLLGGTAISNNSISNKINPSSFSG